ncbi:MAG: lysylphosphatidylglycerol synthase transmembrane domain-containing protein [Rhodothermales bacterium]|nr:lysylphosphatidylglycerol synthase transmembrane domain-containing protein [Rhodothermales bacterium]
MKRFLSYSISLLLGGVLLYLALRGVALGDLGDALARARYVWLLPLLAVIVFAHALRAYRWKMLIEALPPQGASAPTATVSFRTAFLSVLIGYLVNLATPRLGEVVRSANLARQENLRISGVLGTVVIERLLDSLVLLLALVATFALYLDHLAFLDESLWRPFLGALGRISAVSYALATTFGLGAIILAIRAARRSDHRLMRRLRKAALSFRDGMYTLHRSPRRMIMLTTTVAMWGAYVMMAYLPLLMLDMTARYDLGLVDAFAIMVFGSLGIAVPAPGGTGSYHYIIKLALMHVFGIDAADAVVYAVLSHGIQLVLYTLLGAAALVLQGVSWQVLRTDTVESPRKAL